MADDNRTEPDTHEYDDTIPTPDAAAPDDDQDPNPAAPEDGSDTPPAGDQPAADGAIGEDGVPLRADGTPARDKGAVD